MRTIAGKYENANLINNCETRRNHDLTPIPSSLHARSRGDHKAQKRVDQNGRDICHALARAFIHARQKVLLLKCSGGRVEYLEYRGVARAQKASLIDGEWVFEKAEVHEMTGDIIKHKRLQLDTVSEITDLQEHFRHPNTLSVWSLPQYIAAASDTGIDTNSHRVRLYTMLTLPFMLMAMVLVAASFSLPTGRLLSSGRTIGYAILFGFLLFIFGKFVAKLSELNILPILLASLAPPMIATFLAATLLLEAEDG